MDHLFSLYIKSIGKDTVYRIDERKYPHKPPIDFINEVFNPIEKFRQEQKPSLDSKGIVIGKT
jgi:hypothetical protein